MIEFITPSRRRAKRRPFVTVAILLVIAVAYFVVFGRAEARAQEFNWITPPTIQNGERARMTYMDGNAFIRHCERAAVVCGAYIQGVNDALLAATFNTGRDVPYCIPANSTNDQVLAVVLLFIERNPQHRHQPAPVLIASALADAWPQCARNP